MGVERTEGCVCDSRGGGLLRTPFRAGGSWPVNEGHTTYSQLADVNTASRTVGGEQLPVQLNRRGRRGEANFLGGQKDGSLEGPPYHWGQTFRGGGYWRPQNREGRGQSSDHLSRGLVDWNYC